MCTFEIDYCFSSSKVFWSWWVVLEVFSRQYFNAYFSHQYFSKCVFFEIFKSKWTPAAARLFGADELFWKYFQDCISMRIFLLCIFSKCVFLNYFNLNLLLHQQRQQPGCGELMSCSRSISEDCIIMCIVNKCIVWVCILWNWLLHQHQQRQQPGCLELMSRKLRKWEFEFPSLPSMSEHHDHEDG